MIRDFVAGVLWGGVVSVVGLGVISQVAPPPQEAAAPATPAAAAPEAEAAAPAAPAPVTPEAVPEPASPAVEAPEETGVAAAPPAAAVAPDAPLSGAADGAAPETGLPAPEAAAPALPAPDAAPGVPQADAAPDQVAQAPGAEAMAPDAPAAVPPPGETVPAPAAELPPPLPGAPADRLLEPGAPETPAPLPGEVVPAPDAAPADEPAPATEPLPEAGTAEAAPAPAAPKVIEPDSATRLPSAGALPKDAGGVTVGRLPSIGGGTPAAEAPAEPQTAPEDLPPVKRYAAAFENPTGKPLFALILTDDGSPDLDRARLAALPFPVTFVIDPLAANAAEAAATYRAGGKEVVMLATGIPAGATAADLEQSFQAVSAALPEAVAVADLAQGGFQDDRALAAQVVTILKAEGLGLITYDRGLNAADQVARREDLPAATIFRELDAQGEDIPLIRRYLDRAAFKAAQEGRVAVIGTARPETVAAVLEWTIEGRASSVTLAPATAVMVVQ